MAYQAGFAEDRDYFFAAKTNRLLVGRIRERGPVCLPGI